MVCATVIISLSSSAVRGRTLFSVVKWPNDLLPRNQKYSKFNHSFRTMKPKFFVRNTIASSHRRRHTFRKYTTHTIYLSFHDVQRAALRICIKVVFNMEWYILTHLYFISSSFMYANVKFQRFIATDSIPHKNVMRLLKFTMKFRRLDRTFY